MKKTILFSQGPHRPLATGLALLSGTLLGSGWLAPTAQADIAATQGLRSLGTTVNGGASCSSGSCRIGGGRSRGENLYQRLDRFDTRGGISDVLIENTPAHRAVVMGVIGPGRTHITVPVSLQNKAGLMLMSPAGISVSGAGSFLNVSRLGLTNQTGLKVGSGWFDALTTTAGQLDASVAYESPIVFDRASLRTSLDNLDAIGLTGAGSIEIEGVQLVVERNLISDLPAPAQDPPTVLVDAGLAPLTLSGATIKANEVLASGLQGNSSISLYGGTISLSNSQIESSGSGLTADGLEAAAYGRVNLQADGALNLANDSTLRALKIGLYGSDVALNATKVEAPRGLIRIDATKGITLEGSTLDVAPQTMAEGQGPGLAFDFKDQATGTIVTSRTPALIYLASSGIDGVKIRNSTLNANNLPQSANNSGEASTSPANQIAGDLFISARSGPLEIANSDLLASSDKNYAGQVSLLLANSQNTLRLDATNIIANSPNGSGDINVTGEGPVEIIGSTLEANTSEADFSDFLYRYNPPGEIRVSSQSTTTGITIDNSTLRSTYSLSETPTSTYSEFRDRYDDFDAQFFGAPTGGLVRLASKGSISVRGSSTLDVSSNTGIGGNIEFYSAGGSGTSISQSLLNAQTSGPLPNAISTFFGVPAESFEGLRAGSIEIISKNDITITESTLDSSLSTISQVYDLEAGGFVPLSGSIILLTEGSIAINNSSLRSNSPSQPTTSPAAEISPAQDTSESSETNLAVAQLNPVEGSAPEEEAFIAPGDISLQSQGGKIELIAAGSITIDETSAVESNGDSPREVIPEQNSVKKLSDYTRERSRGENYLNAIESEAGFDTKEPQVLKQLEKVQNLLKGDGGTQAIILIQRSPGVIEANVINQNLNTTETNIKQAGQSFDVTSETGLQDLENFLRDLNVAVGEINDVARTVGEDVRQQRIFEELEAAAAARATDQPTLSQKYDIKTQIESSSAAAAAETLETAALPPQLNIQTSLTSPTTANTDQASSQQSGSTLQAALASQVSLSEAQSTSSLQEGEEASRDAMAELLANGSTPPPVPTLLQLQEMLRQAGLKSPGSTADQAAILRISYSADPQAMGQVPYPSGWKEGDLLAQASRAGAGEGSLDLVLITADGQPNGWRSRIQLAEFRDLLRRYYSDLAEQNLAVGATTPAEDAPERRLFELIVGAPMKQLERARVGTLIISADPALIDIPFNALHDGKRYLSQRFSLAITPSLAFTNLTGPAAGRTASSGQRVNAGASMFNNGLTPLPMVEKELAELSGQKSQGPITTLLNRQFNPSSFSSSFADADTRQVHIASHAEIAAGPQRIPTIYTGDTALSLRELGQLRQRSGASNLDLVTLSACRSALNGADLELGFAGLAVQLGAKTAIGTKWYVDDVATSSFFVLFYRQLQQGLAKADALRATQQAFASGQVRVEGTSVIGPGNGVLLTQLPESYQHRYTRGFHHPYYWAGVQLVGSPW